MGGKDAIHLKQLYDSSLQPNELQILLKKLADESFLNGKSGSLSMDNNGFQKKIKVNYILHYLSTTIWFRYCKSIRYQKTIMESI